jgi:hypothetical protein
MKRLVSLVTQLSNSHTLEVTPIRSRVILWKIRSLITQVTCLNLVITTIWGCLFIETTLTNLTVSVSNSSIHRIKTLTRDITSICLNVWPLPISSTSLSIQPPLNKSFSSSLNPQEAWLLLCIFPFQVKATNCSETPPGSSWTSTIQGTWTHTSIIMMPNYILNRIVPLLQ